MQRIYEAHQLAPHRIRTFKLATDPEFPEELKDVVGSGRQDSIDTFQLK